MASNLGLGASPTESSVSPPRLIPSQARGWIPLQIWDTTNGDDEAEDERTSEPSRDPIEFPDDWERAWENAFPSSQINESEEELFSPNHQRTQDLNPQDEAEGRVWEQEIAHEISMTPYPFPTLTQLEEAARIAAELTGSAQDSNNPEATHSEPRSSGLSSYRLPPISQPRFLPSSGRSETLELHDVNNEMDLSLRRIQDIQSELRDIRRLYNELLALDEEPSMDPFSPSRETEYGGDYDQDEEGPRFRTGMGEEEEEQEEEQGQYTEMDEYYGLPNPTSLDDENTYSLDSLLGRVNAEVEEFAIRTLIRTHLFHEDENDDENDENEEHQDEDSETTPYYETSRYRVYRETFEVQRVDPLTGLEEGQQETSSQELTLQEEVADFQRSSSRSRPPRRSRGPSELLDSNGEPVRDVESSSSLNRFTRNELHRSLNDSTESLKGPMYYSRLDSNGFLCLSPEADKGLSPTLVDAMMVQGGPLSSSSMTLTPSLLRFRRTPWRSQKKVDRIGR